MKEMEDYEAQAPYDHTLRQMSDADPRQHAVVVDRGVLDPKAYADKLAWIKLLPMEKRIKERLEYWRSRLSTPPEKDDS